MGHVINPISFRIKITRLWESSYNITNKNDLNYFLMENINLKKLLFNFFKFSIFFKRGFLWSHANFFRVANKLQISVFVYRTHDEKDKKNIYFRKITFRLFLHFFKKIIPKLLLNFLKNLIIYNNLLLNKIEKFYFLTKKQNIIILLIFLKKKYKFKSLFNYLHFFFFKNRKPLFKLNKSHFLIRKFKFLLRQKKKYIIKSKRKFLFQKNYFRNYGSKLDTEYKNNFLFNFFLWYLRGRFWQKIIFFFKKIFSFFFKIPVLFKICKINFIGVNVNIVGAYIINKLKLRFKIFQTISPVLRDLKSNKSIKGFKFSFCGRFSRKEMATCQWFSNGKVPSNTFNSFIEYKLFTVILKDSLCGIKIWITRHKKYAAKYSHFSKISNVIWFSEEYEK